MVTGAGSGVGEAVAQHRAALGDSVIAVLRPGGSRPAVAEVAQVVECDLVDPASIELAAAAVGEVTDQVDLLVHAAGVAELGPLEELTAQVLHDHLAVNLSAVIQLTTLLRPALASSPEGLVVGCSSEQVQHPGPANVAYGASKAGLEFALQALAVGLAEDGTRVNCLVLGGIDTPMLRRFVPAPAKPDNLLGLTGTTGDVAAAVDYLVGAPFTTGANLAVDGGASLL